MLQSLKPPHLHEMYQPHDAHLGHDHDHDHHDHPRPAASTDQDPAPDGSETESEGEELWIVGGAGYVSALSWEDFKLVWSTRLPSNSSNYVSVICSKGSVFTASGGDLICLDYDTGEMKWRSPILPENEKEKKHISMFTGIQVLQASPTLLIACYGRYVTAFSSGGQRNWTNKLPESSLSSGVVTGGDVLVNSNGQVYDISLETGEIKWSTNLSRYGVWHSLVLLPNGLISVGSWGKIVQIDRNNGQKVGLTNNLKGFGYGYVIQTLMEECLVIFMNKYLVALDHRTQEVLWSREVSFRTHQIIPYYGKCPCVILLQTTHIMAINVCTGSILWSFQTPRDPYTYSRVYGVPHHHMIYAFHSSNTTLHYYIINANNGFLMKTGPGNIAHKVNTMTNIAHTPNEQASTLFYDIYKTDSD